MSKKTEAQRDAERRAEARRRSRLAAQGRTPIEDSDEVAAAPARQPSMSFLARLFPPAAPLPGKPPPLTGFTYTGRLRPLVLGGWLIRQNLYAGIGMGILWAASYVLTVQEGRSIFGTIASFVSFGALVAAGWIGWQRPWFYGFVAAVVGYIAYAIYFIALFAGDPAINALATPSQVATYLLHKRIAAGRHRWPGRLLRWLPAPAPERPGHASRPPPLGVAASDSAVGRRGRLGCRHRARVVGRQAQHLPG